MKTFHVLALSLFTFLLKRGKFRFPRWRRLRNCSYPELPNPQGTQIWEAGNESEPGFRIIRAGSRRNSQPISCELAAYFSLEITPLSSKKSPNLMTSQCVLFNYSNFRSRMLEIHSRRPRFKNFSRGHAPRPPCNSRFHHLQVAPVARVYSFSGYSKPFATNIKPYWKPWVHYCQHFCSSCSLLLPSFDKQGLDATG